jgi:DNA polymerase (family 10)
VPPTLVDLLKVPDNGPKKVTVLWKQGASPPGLNWKLLPQWETAWAARNGREIGSADSSRLQALARRSKRLPLGVPRRLPALGGLAAKLPDVEQVAAAGSLRRRKIHHRRLDFVVASSDPGPIMKASSNIRMSARRGQGENKSSIEASGGLNIQLWIQPPRAL